MGSHERIALSLIVLGACAIMLVGSDPTVTLHDGTSGAESEAGMSTRKLLDELDMVTKRESKGILETVDGNPEFQVRVQGQNAPLCFTLHGQTQQVFRLVQDPHTGIIVNARVFVDDVTGRTYLGAIIISKGKFRVLAKQHVVMVNKVKFHWDQLNMTTFQGNRVLVARDRVIVKFRKHQIVLEVRRSFLKHPGSFGHSDGLTTAATESVEFPDPTDTEADADRLVDPDSKYYIHNDRDGPREGDDPDEPFKGVKNSATNIVPSLLKWASWFSWGSINNQPQGKLDGTWTDSVAVDDSEEKSEDSYVSPSEKSEISISTRHKRSVGIRTETGSLSDESLGANRISLGDRQILSQNQYLINQLEKQMKSSQSMRVRDLHSLKRRKLRKGGRYKEMVMPHKATIFLGFYILEGRGFSNMTHGLLGQFLFKSARSLKMNWGDSGGLLQALFEVNGDPDRTAQAVYIQRQHVGSNTTRACWLLTNGGRSVVDGEFSDYLVPHIRYNSLRELPPPAPL